MPSYYHDVIGNLNMGDVAKSSDIHHIQRHIKDALKEFHADLYDGESYVLGSNNTYKNSFILTAASKESGKYIDGENVFEEETDFININYNDVKQPIIKTKTSLYSIITKLRNTSNKDIPVTFELQDEYGETLRTNTITIDKNTPSGKYEIVFDLDFCPAPPNKDFKQLINEDGFDVPPRTDEKGFTNPPQENAYDDGYKEEHSKEMKDESLTGGLSKLYFVIKRTNLNAIDLVDSSTTEEPVFDANSSLGVYCSEGSPFPGDKEFYAEVNPDKTYSLTNKNIYYQDIYANEMTYLCSGGRAVIGGEKVTCLDTHISIEGGNSLGNTLTQIYLGEEGHLHSANKKTSFTTDISEFEDDEEDPLPPYYLPVALILTYSNAQYGTSKEPLVIQADYSQLPRSHHERLRRLEKQMDWSNDIALPARIKYSISDGDWIDEYGEDLVQLPHNNDDSNDSKKATDKDKLSNDNIFKTTDENGNLVVKLSNEKTQSIPITLKEKLKDSEGKAKKLEKTDILNASSFSKIEHMVHDSKNGTLVLDTKKEEDKDKKKDTKNKSSKKTTKTDKKTKTKTTTKTSQTSKDLSDFNPWNDDKVVESLINNKKHKKIEREFTVEKGKNGASDNDSSYPGMTFYTDTNYNLKKLTIPLYKFKNCSAVKFYIWKRHDKNITNKSVPDFKKSQLIHTTPPFSLKKAKTKGKYQYMEKGFTINFEKDGKKGLSLKKGQYVVIALPIPKSGSGSVYVETYKPKNSKNVCIKYTGAANTSHFHLSHIYQEVWYSDATAVATKEDYYTKGTVTSKTLTWDDPGLERIKSVKPIVNNNLTLGNKTKDSYTLWVSTGGDWVKVEPNKENKIKNGGATTFKWKLEFKGDGKSTPKLAYNKKKGYAIKFSITREKPGADFDLSSSEDINKNMCITSKPFIGDDILREYIGDMNFALTHSRFEGYEFARVWASELENQQLLIDIQASDRKFKYKEAGKEVDLWSLHYCDLTLDDFEKNSVDYNDYSSEIEYDENNIRLKLDSDYTYNDNDIQISAFKDFVKPKNDIDETEEKEAVLSNKTSVTENQTLLKNTFENPVDLTKYTGLKFKFKTKSVPTTSSVVKGLGIYISNTEEKDTPSNIKNLPENLYKDAILKDTDIIPDVIDPDESSYSYYDGKLIQILHEVNSLTDGNKITKPGFYQYIQVYDDNKNKYVWKKQQVFDLRSYSIYEIGDITYSEGEDTFEVRIEIDQESNNLKYVKEIGILSLNDEEKYSYAQTSIETKLSASCDENGKIVLKLTDKNDTPLKNKTIFYGTDNNSLTTSLPTTGDDGKTPHTGLANKEGKFIYKYPGEVVESTDADPIRYSESYITVDYNFKDNKKEITESENKSVTASSLGLSIESIKGLREDYLTIYDPEDTKAQFVSNRKGVTTIYPCDKLKINTTTYSTTIPTELNNKIKTTTPKTTQINIKHKDNTLQSPFTLCYVNNPFQGGISNYRHIGIQLATDVYIPKDSLKINICADINGQTPIASVNLPTMNSIYYPNSSQGNINLSQVFKKFNVEDVEIKSISISTTSHFFEFVGDVVNKTKPAINLFIGKIILYKARTIPIYHNKMRFKFYSTVNGEIQHYGEQMSEESIAIRKIGAVLDYD